MGHVESHFPGSPYGAQQPHIYDNAMYASPAKGAQPVTAAYDLKVLNNALYQAGYGSPGVIGVPHMSSPQHLTPVQAGGASQQMGPLTAQQVGPGSPAQMGLLGQFQVGPNGPAQLGQPFAMQGQSWPGQRPVQPGGMAGKPGAMAGPCMPANGMQMGLSMPNNHINMGLSTLNNGMQAATVPQLNDTPTGILRSPPEQLLAPSQLVVLQAAQHAPGGALGLQPAAPPTSQLPQPRMLQPGPLAAGVRGDMQVPGPRGAHMLGHLPPTQLQVSQHDSAAWPWLNGQLP